MNVHSQLHRPGICAVGMLEAGVVTGGEAWIQRGGKNAACLPRVERRVEHKYWRLCGRVRPTRQTCTTRVQESQRVMLMSRERKTGEDEGVGGGRERETNVPVDGEMQ